MVSDSTRRLLEASSPEISDSHLRLIRTMDTDPNAELRRLERLGYKTESPGFVDTYMQKSND